nr:PQQ-binding-like beta-propeller repeat protein [Deltaproteobacteria bacterium]
MDTSSAPRAVFTLGTLAFNPVDGVVQLALDRAGTLLAASSPPGRVHLYDLPDGSPRPPLLGAPEDRSWWQSPSVVTRSLAVSPDGGSVAMHQGGRLCLWSAADGALRWSAELASSSPRAVAFADERTLLVGGCGDALRSYDALTGALRWARELPQRDGRPPVHLALATSPDGRRLFAATHERSHVVSVDDGPCSRRSTHRACPAPCSRAPRASPPTARRRSSPSTTPAFARGTPPRASADGPTGPCESASP